MTNQFQLIRQQKSFFIFRYSDNFVQYFLNVAFHPVILRLLTLISRFSLYSGFMFQRSLLLLKASLVIAFFCSLGAQAQSVFPLFHFRQTAANSSVRYRDNFFSGFMQGEKTDSLNGFLQMPFVGRPLLVYIGEKDSTQYMAYASSYNSLHNPAQGELSLQENYSFMLNRYGVKAEVKSVGNVVEQTYTYPDTTAEKGFLVDIDHALGGLPDGNMNVRFVDHQTICAFKRSSAANAKTLYYYARFSKRFDSYNIRRESVTLKDGSKEARLKAVFTFDLAKDEPLKVVSAVSERSADDAYALVEKSAPKSALTKPLLASVPKSAEKSVNRASAVNAKIQTAASKTSTALASNNTRTTERTSRSVTAQKAATATVSKSLADKVVVETRDAALRTAFYVAFERVMQTPSFKKISSAADFVQTLSAQMLSESSSLQQQADTIVKRYVAGCMNGSSTSADTDGKGAMRFLLCSIGLYPEQAEASMGEQSFAVVRPLFNVVTLYYADNRRFIFHVKNASSAKADIRTATFNGEKLALPPVVSQKQLLRGGVLAVKM